MTILVDMDDTIEQLLKAWIDAVNLRYDRAVDRGDVTEWDVSAAFPGLTRDEVFSVLTQPGFWKKVEPMPGAADALRHFMAEGHAVYIVTATPYESVPEKMTDCLFRLFPFLRWDQVIVASSKQLIRGDVLIDDGVHNLEGGPYAKLLMTAPHNQSYDAAAHGMIRVNRWAEAVDAVDALAAEHAR